MKSLKGQFLVATAALLDSNFSKTVILLFDHTPAGAAGVVINRTLDATVTEIAEQVFESPFDWEKPIHLGGPVSGPLMVLHLDEALADQEVLPGLYSTIEAEKVREIFRRRVEPSLVVANYAGWGPGQLERELAEDSWTVHPATADRALRGDEDLWDEFETAAPAEGTLNLAELLQIEHVPDDPGVN